MTRLDRFLGKALAVPCRDVRLMLAQGRVEVDGDRARSISQVIHPFSEVRCDGRILRGRTPRYVMLHKPRGVVSATRDDQHRTAIDLLAWPWKSDLHIAGRLDRMATGLLLLTNDGRWSRWLCHPESKQCKRYQVRVARPLGEADVAAFRRGFHLAYEGVWTRPAELTIRGEREAEVTLVEGRYHQIRRMFAACGNQVLAIHRSAVGALELDSGLAPGQSRELTNSELASLAG